MEKEGKTRADTNGHARKEEAEEEGGGGIEWGKKAKAQAGNTTGEVNFTVCTLKVKATGESIIDERGRETGTHSHSAGEIGNEDEEEEEEDQRRMIELGQVEKKERKKEIPV